ncbi:MAG: hypothetical protein IGS54_15635 [Elainella sp. C42_A2020_010]|nr:hypothetical protein [Elainella sp. C42_A2020_010]
MWRAQLPTDPSTPKPYEEIRAELQRGMTALDTLLEGVEVPLGALRFVHNLVEAATNVESLSEEGDAQFLRELVAFGFEYAKLNPTPLESATDNGTEAFLATLWQSNSTEAESIAVKAATRKLSELFARLDTPEERLQWLKFATTLAQAVRRTPQSLAQDYDPTFVTALIELGALYLPICSSVIRSTNGIHCLKKSLFHALFSHFAPPGATYTHVLVQDVRIETLSRNCWDTVPTP